LADLKVTGRKRKIKGLPANNAGKDRISMVMSDILNRHPSHLQVVMLRRGQSISFSIVQLTWHWIIRVASIFNFPHSKIEQKSKMDNRCPPAGTAKENWQFGR
jgi:hypothetical protein